MLTCEAQKPQEAGRYRDHLEEYLALRPGGSPTYPAVVENSLRAFLECGVP